MQIESLQNNKIKFLNRILTDNRFRKKEGVFAVEGQQENQRALQFGYEANEFFICKSIFTGTIPERIKMHLVSEKVYDKIAYRGSTEGIIGIYKTQTLDLHSYQPKENATIIILESVEKPGNLGAIMRSCEAFGIDALIVTNTKADFYNPNVLRSSVGCLFGLNIFSASNEETLKFLQKNKVNVLTTYMDKTAEVIGEVVLKNKSAIIFGTEHSGITQFWKGIGENILIPTIGTIDSLNLSNAVAIVCYESLRQKNPAKEREILI